ncbi:MAG: glycosyltransferase [Pelobium sp.]
MHILIHNNSLIPALKYGGTERVIWDLGRTLTKKGHKVTFLMKTGSYCDFADVIFYNASKTLNEQIPNSVDIAHLFISPKEAIKVPYVVTIEGNPGFGEELDEQCIFVSKNHAMRYNSTQYVHNGIDWDNYAQPDLSSERKYFHFLANAAWKVKNVRGAISMTKKAGERLEVLGGHRLNLKMGLRITLDTHVRFRGMVDNDYKSKAMNQSKGLIFPVLWNEPFGIAIIESLYFGCPVFGTPYGSLPELIHEEVGFLSNKESAITEALTHVADFDKNKCHTYARDCFSAEKMTEEYLKFYEKALNGHKLNPHQTGLMERPVKYLPLD